MAAKDGMGALAVVTSSIGKSCDGGPHTSWNGEGSSCAQYRGLGLSSRGLCCVTE